VGEGPAGRWPWAPLAALLGAGLLLAVAVAAYLGRERVRQAVEGWLA
jgi:hypothetical protein